MTQSPRNVPMSALENNTKDMENLLEEAMDSDFISMSYIYHDNSQKIIQVSSSWNIWGLQVCGYYYKSNPAIANILTVNIAV